MGSIHSLILHGGGSRCSVPAKPGSQLVKFYRLSGVFVALLVCSGLHISNRDLISLVFCHFEVALKVNSGASDLLS